MLQSIWAYIISHYYWFKLVIFSIKRSNLHHSRWSEWSMEHLGFPLPLIANNKFDKYISVILPIQVLPSTIFYNVNYYITFITLTFSIVINIERQYCDRKNCDVKFSAGKIRVKFHWGQKSGLTNVSLYVCYRLWVDRKLVQKLNDAQPQQFYWFKQSVYQNLQVRILLCISNPKFENVAVFYYLLFVSIYSFIQPT